MTGALPFIIRRILAAIPVLFFVSAATFALGRYAPGDPIAVRAGPRADPAQIERIKTNLGLNDPVPVQYVRYMGKFLRGDLGESYRRPGIQISEIVFPKAWVSLRLNLLPFLLEFAIGVPLGVYLALHRGRWQDPALTTFLLMLASTPVFVTIPLLTEVLARRLGVVPTTGWDGIFSASNIIPVVILTLPALAGVARTVRISMLQTMGEDFVRTARAKGLRESVVISRHILRNSLLILINGIILGLIFLYTGSFFVENLLGIPGLAKEAYESIGARDYDLFMALTLFSAILFIVANLLLDIAYTIIDPRIRYT